MVAIFEYLGNDSGLNTVIVIYVTEHILKLFSRKFLIITTIHLFIFNNNNIKLQITLTIYNEMKKYFKVSNISQEILQHTIIFRFITQVEKNQNYRSGRTESYRID